MRTLLLISIALGVCLYGPASSGQQVTIPDPVLENCIRAAADKMTGPLYVTDLRGITELSFTDCLGIADLTGLEYCTNLTYLDIRNNRIRNASPVGALTNLTWLVVSNNYIEDASFLANLVKLEHLEISGNRLRAIEPLANLTALEELHASCNLLESVPSLTGLSSLVFADFSDNRLEDLDFLAECSLDYLNASHNRIQELPDHSWTQMGQLYLTNNRLTSIASLAQCLGITKLAIDGNSIADLSPLGGMSQLKTLNCSHNSITNLQPIAGLGLLEEIDASWNQLTSLPALSGPIASLNASHNALSTVAAPAQTDWFCLVDLSYNQLSSLAALSGLTASVGSREWNFSHNLLTAVPLASVANLNVLDVSHNALTSLADLGSASKLQRLDASFNQIANIQAINSMPGGTFDLSHNDIASLYGVIPPLFPGTGGGSELNLSFNQISDLGPMSGQCVHTLDVSWNDVASVAGLNFSSIQNLDIAGNNLADLNGVAWGTLYTLDVSYNHLNGEDALAGVPSEVLEVSVAGNGITDFAILGLNSNIRYFNASYNSITDAAPVYAATPNAIHVDLSHNQLATLPPFPEQKLQMLNVSYNNLTAVPTFAHTALAGIDVSHNRLTSLNLDRDLRVNTVNASYNMLTAISGKVAQYFNVSHNGISDLSSLNVTDFNWNEQGFAINLSFNRLRDIDVVEDWVPPELSYIDFSNNRISDVAALPAMPNPMAINLGHNQIHDVSPLLECRLCGFNIEENPTGLVDSLVEEIGGPFVGVSDYQVTDPSVLRWGQLKGVAYHGRGNRDVSELLEHRYEGLRIEQVGIEDTSGFNAYNIPVYLNLRNNKLRTFDLPSLPPFLDVSCNKLTDASSFCMQAKYTGFVNVSENPITDVSPLLMKSGGEPYELPDGQVAFALHYFMTPDQIAHFQNYELVYETAHRGQVDLSGLSLDEVSADVVAPALDAMKIEVITDDKCRNCEYPIKYEKSMFEAAMGCAHAEKYNLSIPADVQLELLARILETDMLPLNQEAAGAFEHNRAQLRADLHDEVLYELVGEDCLALWAALITIGDVQLIGEVEACTPAKRMLDLNLYDLSVAPYLAPEGDYDGDGTSNEDEYAADPVNYLDEMATLPANGAGAIVLLTLTFAVAGWCRLGKRRSFQG